MKRLQRLIEDLLGRPLGLRRGGLGASTPSPVHGPDGSRASGRGQRQRRADRCHLQRRSMVAQEGFHGLAEILDEVKSIDDLHRVRCPPANAVRIEITPIAADDDDRRMLRQPGRHHPDRDAQFQYLNTQIKTFLAQGWSVVSVEAKKKELVGAFKNGGWEWQPQGHPEEVKVHDFPDLKLGKAIPDGVYDVGRNAGWVTVGQDHDTASFAIASFYRWWQAVGRNAYPQANRLLISAASGGSKGYRTRLWKVELPHFVDATGLQVTVCHLPPGTSTWNKIEHRLFSHISMNWRSRPLVSHEVIVELIGATTTRTGLQVQAALDPGAYPTKIKVSAHEMATLQMTPHPFHGEWNYTILPTSSEAEL